MGDASGELARRGCTGESAGATAECCVSGTGAGSAHACSVTSITCMKRSHGVGHELVSNSCHSCARVSGFSFSKGDPDVKQKQWGGSIEF